MPGGLEQHTGPEQRSDDYGDRGVGRFVAEASGSDDQHRRQQDPERPADQQGDSGQGGDHEAGKQAVGQGFGAVGELVQHDPAADRATDQTEHADLEQGTKRDAVGKWFGDYLHGQWPPCS
jgi:hypothetical protein